MKEIDKIIKSTTPPKSKDVLWDNGKELLINRNGKWENANTTEIKEGSIPLSALDDNIKSSIAYVGTLSVENPIITLQTYAKYLLNGQYIIYPGQTITLYGRLNIEYSVNTGTPKLIAHYVDNITAPISVHRSRDIHSFELPTSIANWNADKGEPGYIENKPFELWNKCGFTLGNGVNIIEVTSNARFICFNDMVIELPQFEDGTEFSIISGPPVSIKCTYIRGHAHLELIDPTNYFSKTTIEFYSNIKLINAIYLPETVIKTTPQTLSDAEKNQALTNLGIDPVVWKYICKPYIFNGLDYSNGSKIPSELLENGKLKYKIPAMYRIQVDNNYYNSDSGEQVDFTDINNLYGEYTPESVDSNSLQTTSLFGEYLVLIHIPLNDEGRWTIEVTV